MKSPLEIVIIILASGIIGFGFNQLRENPLPIIYEAEILVSGAFIDFDQAIALHRKHEALFIDARSPDEFETGRIQGALNIPLKWSRTKKMEIMADILKNTNIVIYCSNSECNSAERLAGELKYAGYDHVAVFSGGWDEWKRRKAPLE